MTEKAPYKTEAALCEAFIPWARQQGWTVYPETADFDLLLVDKEGHQCGVEAKLRLNAKVIAQALPGWCVTREMIRDAGIDPRRWFNSDRWLEPIGNGQYTRGAKLPPFDEQHPDVFAAIVAEMRAGGAKVAA